MDPSSASASEIATWAIGTRVRHATIADEYSAGSRTTRSGRHAAQSAAIVGSIASVARRPNSSRLPRRVASSGGTTGRRSRMGATSVSGGSPPGWNG